MDSASRSPASKPRAVHMKRRRVPPEQRKRVAIACNECSSRRIKCSGDRPCRQCSLSLRPCEYPDAVDKISMPRAQLEALQKRCAYLEQCLETSEIRPPSIVPSVPPSPVYKDSEDATPPEGRLLNDPDGTARYFGESSGANFLNHVKEFMTTILPLISSPESGQPDRFLASVGSYQTFDSRPLSLPHANPLSLPRRTDMMVMLTDFCYLLHDGNRDFPSGGIFYWGDLPSVPPEPDAAPGLQESGHLAFLQIVFAVASQMGSATQWEDEPRSETYFSRARQIIGNPLDFTKCVAWNVSPLLVMALYLIEVNRRDAAYMTVSVALRLAVMYGAHTGCGGDEGKKRVFWTLYILDGWMSAWLGRPPAIADEAIRLDPPQEAGGFPPAAGLRAHVELTRISRYIMCNVYRIAPWDRGLKTTVQHVEHAMNLLHKWLDSLPPLLQVNYEELGQDRACCSLHLTYNQLVILTARPVFFIAVKKALADRYVSNGSNRAAERVPSQTLLIQQCVHAARQNLRLGRWIRRLSPRQRLLHYETHAVFNAAIILLLNQMAVLDSELQDAGDIGFAIEVFEHEASLGSNFGVDCASVLQDLQLLVQGLRKTGRRLSNPMIRQDPTINEEGPIGSFPTDPDRADIDGEMQQADFLLTMDSGNLYEELQGWLDNDYYQLYSNCIG